jgi:alpha-beta hydrolase superfamily lysophospholipase
VLRVPHENVRAEPSHPGWSGVTLTASDGVELRAWLARPKGPAQNCVALLHGINDTTGMVRFAPMFLENGYTVLLPDSRGHGRSGGSMVTYGVLEKYDVVGWIQVLRQNGCEKIYGLGESLGAATLIQTSAITNDFRAIAAEGSFADLKSVGEHRVGKMFHSQAAGKLFTASASLYARAVYHLDLAQASPLESIRVSTTPILLIHGLADDQTPPENSKALALANPRAQLWLVPGAFHVGAYSARPAEFRARVLNWFAQH